MAKYRGKAEEILVRRKRYRDKNGDPTCAINFETGEVCEYYRTTRFGCNETCLFADEHGRTERRDKGDGTLIPQDCCPLFKPDVELDDIAVLMDGCIDVVELWKAEHPSQKKWKEDWLKRARSMGASAE